MFPMHKHGPAHVKTGYLLHQCRVFFRRQQHRRVSTVFFLLLAGVVAVTVSMVVRTLHRCVFCLSPRDNRSFGFFRLHPRGPDRLDVGLLTQIDKTIGKKPDIVLYT